MEISPYQAPRPGEPVLEPKLDDAASIRQLLIEIRDAQRETADLLRQSELRQQKATRSMYPMRIIGLVVPLLFLAIFFYMRSKMMPLPLPPARAPIRAPR